MVSTEVGDEDAINFKHHAIQSSVSITSSVCAVFTPLQKYFINLLFPNSTLHVTQQQYHLVNQVQLLMLPRLLRVLTL